MCDLLVFEMVVGYVWGQMEWEGGDPRKKKGFALYVVSWQGGEEGREFCGKGEEEERSCSVWRVLRESLRSRVDWSTGPWEANWGLLGL